MTVSWSLCYSGVVQEEKYGSKGALLPPYHTTSTKSSTMADQLMDLPDIYSVRWRCVCKQASVHFSWIDKKRKKDRAMYPGPCRHVKHRQNTLIKITLHHKSSPYVCGIFTTELSTAMVDDWLNAHQNVIWVEAWWHHGWSMISWLGHDISLGDQILLSYHSNYTALWIWQ